MPFFPQSSGLCSRLFLCQGLPVFLLLLSPTFFQVWRHLPLQEALLDLTGQAGTSSVFPQPHCVFLQWCLLFPTPIFCTYHHWCLQILGPCVWADGLFFQLVLGLERQPRPCPHPPDQGQKHCLGASRGFLPLTDYDLTSPSLGFLVCKMGILTSVSGGSDENKMSPKSAKHEAITYGICCLWNLYLGSPSQPSCSSFSA